MSRRQFLEAATGASLLMDALPRGGASAQASPVSAARAFTDRIAFAPWMNDVRTEPLPFAAWPADAFDDTTVASLARTLELDAAWGYNYFDIYGLFATWGWPADLAAAATPERVRRVRQVIDAAHANGIGVVYGLGVYSWGFDEIIAADPAVRGPNPHAMCASKEGSWLWQKKLIDFLLQFDLDGFHLESADLGRCTCQQCMAAWPHQAAYHNHITSRTARYIRSVRPEAYVVVTLISWADWNTGLTEQDKDALVELSRSVDCIVDQGHHSCYLKQAERAAFIDRLHCRYGTSGGLWVYPTVLWDRLQWFLPYPKQTGRHIRDLYADGGRAVMYYQGPPNNPGVEINIAFGGQLLRNVDGGIDESLAIVLERLYEPRSPAALDRLVRLVRAAEDAYFDHMDWDEEHRYLRGQRAFPGPGEFHLSRPITGIYGTPDYLLEPHLTTAGRLAYNAALEACLKEAHAIADQFAARERMERLQTAMLNALMMLRAAITSVQWREHLEAQRG